MKFVLLIPLPNGNHSVSVFCLDSSFLDRIQVTGLSNVLIDPFLLENKSKTPQTFNILKIRNKSKYMTSKPLNNLVFPKLICLRFTIFNILIFRYLAKPKVQLTTKISDNDCYVFPEHCNSTKHLDF